MISRLALLCAGGKPEGIRLWSFSSDPCINTPLCDDTCVVKDFFRKMELEFNLTDVKIR